MDPDRRAFLEERQDGIGSSDVGAILGLDPFKTPLEVYHDKTRPVVETPQSVHILRGNLLEPVAAKQYMEETGRKVRRIHRRTHPDFPWAASNADRHIDGMGPLEIKCPASFSYARILDAGMYPAQIAQAQWHMWVHRKETGAFAVFNLESEPPLVHFDLERDDHFIKLAQTAAAQMWRCVLEHQPPEPGQFEPIGELAAAELPALEGTLQVSEGALMEEVALYAEIIDSAKQFELLKDGHKAALMEALTNRATKKVEAIGVGAVSIVDQPGRVSLDKKQLISHRPLDRDAVRRFLNRNELEGVWNTLAADCELDLDRFMRRGDDFQQLRFYPEKKKARND